MSEYLTDPFYTPTGSFQETPGGGLIQRDPFGAVQSRFEPDGLGGGRITDACSRTLGYVKKLGDEYQVQSPGMATTGFIRPQGTGTVFQTAMRQTVASYDPLTRSFSGSMGQLMGRSFSR
jgi:hypothetical protein